MTVNASNTRELNIDEIILRAAQLGGVMSLDQAATGTQWNNRAAFGRDQLDLILDRMPTQGVIVRDIEFYTLTLPVSSNYGGEDDPISMPADTVDVFDVAMYRETSTATEQRVVPVSREAWQESLDKDTTAAPTRYYVQRAGTIYLYLLPVPDTSGAELRVQRKKLLANSNVGSDTLDLERYWLDYIQFELAWRYALQGSLPMDRRADLRSQANDAKAAALAKAKQQLPNQIELDHGTRWT